MAVGLFCSVLWVCFVVAMGLLVMLCWCLGRLCCIFFFFLFMIGDFVWSGLRKKIEDLGWLVFFFFFFSCCGLVASGGGGGGGCRCG